MAPVAGEREALFQELNRRCDEVSKLNAEQMRLEMASELQKVNASSSEMLLKQKAKTGWQWVNFR